MDNEVEKITTPDGDSASAENVEGAPTSLWPILCHLGRVFMSLMSDLWDVVEDLFFAAFNLLVGLGKVANNLWCNWIKPNWKSDDWHGKAAVIEFFIIAPLLLWALFFGSGSPDKEGEGKESRAAVECRDEVDNGPSIWGKIKDLFSSGKRSNGWSSSNDEYYRWSESSSRRTVRWICTSCGNQVTVTSGEPLPCVSCPMRQDKGVKCCIWKQLH